MEYDFRMENKMESLEGCKMEQQWKTHCVFHVFSISHPSRFSNLFSILLSIPKTLPFSFPFSFHSERPLFPFQFPEISRPFRLPSWLRCGKTEWTKMESNIREKNRVENYMERCQLEMKHDEPTVGGLNFHKPCGWVSPSRKLGMFILIGRTNLPLRNRG